MYGIPRTTLRSKLKSMYSEKVGRPTALTDLEENTLSEGLQLCGEWGFPLTSEDVCDVVQTYLQKSGKVITAFTNNRPGQVWVRSFLNRHTELSKRLCENVKRRRAAVSREIVREYFANLTVSLHNVPPANIVNYDETNFTDDPGVKLVIVRRGTRHPERIIDTSKTSTSVMFSVTGDGQMLPPYVVYKATHLYDTWTEGGPEKTCYNRTASGWFDMEVFEDWFFKIAVPYLKSKTGPKAVIGDNLASHLSLSVVKACEDNNICFILLPPNSTHLTQPLDVSFFRPLKAAWRKELDDFKKKNRGVIPKAVFSRRMKSALERIAANSSKTIQSGFRACGIIPLDPESVLKRLPSEGHEDTTKSLLSDSLLSNLQKNRFQEEPSSSTSKKKKLSVKPGESVQVSAFTEIQNYTSQSQSKKKKKKTVAEENDRLLEEEEDDVQAVNEAGEESGESNKENNNTIIRDKDFVLVSVEVEGGNVVKYFVGQVVTDVDNDYYEINFLRKREGRGSLYFVFPTVPDVSNVNKLMIQRKLEVNESKRGCYKFNSLDNFSLLC
ncbi:Pogo transposable element with KRAB domain [Frankliniella fusca]|uniref:Pogo transposable element with KRAB domain n=1 Tax=Frankliniella fusca TaxID=407009 RepID=A0AAE1I119_9NEOP|nr:Pogo transposable element with KRAB domain [Frankliniella fusca]